MIRLTAVYLILVKNCHVSKKDSSGDGLFGDSYWSWSEDQSQSTPGRGRPRAQLAGLSIHSVGMGKGREEGSSCRGCHNGESRSGQRGEL